MLISSSTPVKSVRIIYYILYKVKALLNEKKKITKLRINELAIEKNKLQSEIYTRINTEPYKKIDLLEQEINYYQNLTNSCIKSSSQLTEELITLKRQLSKFDVNSLNEEPFTKKLNTKKMKK